MKPTTRKDQPDELEPSRCFQMYARWSGVLTCFWLLIFPAIFVPAILLTDAKNLALETDIAAYVKSDLPASMDWDLYTSAQDYDYNGAESIETTTSRRRLQTLSTETIEIFYEALEDDETGKPNAFTVSVLERIKIIEDGIAELPNYSTYCLPPSEGEIAQLMSIDRPIPICATSQPNQDSIINYFYAEYLGDTSLEDFFEGQGDVASMLFLSGDNAQMNDIELILDIMLDKQLTWYADKDFSTSNKRSLATRSALRFQVVKSEQSKLDDFLINELVPYLEKTSNDQVRVLYYNKITADAEIRETLISDITIAGGSTLFVFLVMCLHTGSILKSLIGCLGILYSFPLTYAIFFTVFGREMSILNFLAIFVILGIGADDMFVFADLFVQSKALFARHDASGAAIPVAKKDRARVLSQRFQWTFYRAFSTTLITSLTTAVSFLANLSSVIVPIRDFGLFVGLNVIMNFVVYITIFPVAVVTLERYNNVLNAPWRMLTGLCGYRNGHNVKGDVSTVSDEEEANPAENEIVMADEYETSGTDDDDAGNNNNNNVLVARPAVTPSSSRPHLLARLRQSGAGSTRFNSFVGLGNPRHLAMSMMDEPELQVLTKAMGFAATERLFFNRIAPTVNKCKLVIIIGTFVFTAIFAGLALVNVKPTDKIPVFFGDNTNLGRANTIAADLFEFDNVGKRRPPSGGTLNQCEDGVTGVSCNIKVCPGRIGLDVFCNGPTRGICCDGTNSESECTGLATPQCFCLDGGVPGSCAAFPITDTPVSVIVPAATGNGCLCDFITIAAGDGYALVRSLLADEYLKIDPTNTVVKPFLMERSTITDLECSCLATTPSTADTGLVMTLKTSPKFQSEVPTETAIVEVVSEPGTIGAIIVLDATLTLAPSNAPTFEGQTQSPTTLAPTKVPSGKPTTASPTNQPVEFPTADKPSKRPTTLSPSRSPVTKTPTRAPSTGSPTTLSPSLSPTLSPSTSSPSLSPSKTPTTITPTSDAPTLSPTTKTPTTANPTSPEGEPSMSPIKAPTKSPLMPSSSPSITPSMAPSTSGPTAPTLPPVFASLAPTSPPTCPACGEHGECDAQGLCECDTGFKGTLCSALTCEGYNSDPELNNECNTNGRCNLEGTCECDTKHEGVLCEITKPAEVSDFLGEDVYLFMGLNDVKKDGTVVHNVIDFNTAEAQLAALEICRSFCPETSAAGAVLLADYSSRDYCTKSESLLANNDTGTWETVPPRAASAVFMTFSEKRALQLRYLESCPFGAFFDQVSGNKTLPIANVGQKYYEYLKPRYKNRGIIAGFDLTVENEAKLLWTAVRLQTTISTRSGAFEAVKVYDKWDEFTAKVGQALAAIAPDQEPNANAIKLGSPLFARSVTEIAAVQGTVDAFLISNLAALGSILIFTRNPVIAIVTWLSIVVIIGILLGFMILVFSWEFGVIEAISVTVFVGLSVDYCLHMANSFNESVAATTYLRVRSALTQTGVSITGAAITTIGSSFFLLFCDIKIFVQFGQVSMMSLLVALLIAVLFLPAVLILVGPKPGRFCPDVVDNWKSSYEGATGSVRDSDSIRSGGGPEDFNLHLQREDGGSLLDC